jgi:hypothetical protein
MASALDLSYEIIKREFLVAGLDEPFSLVELVSVLKSKLIELGEENLREKINEAVCDFLRAHLFVAGHLTDDESGFKILNPDYKEALKIVRVLIDEASLEDHALWNNVELWSIYLSLTDEGKYIAQDYWNKKVLIREKALLASLKKHISIHEFIKIVQSEFPAESLLELAYEASYALELLLNDNDFMVVGRLEQNTFVPSKEQNLIGLEYIKKHFLNTLDSANHDLVNIYLKNTDNANNIIEQWELGGG